MCCLSAPVIMKCSDYDKSNDNERNDNDNRDCHISTMLFVLASHHEVSRGDLRWSFDRAAFRTRPVSQAMCN